MRGGVVSRCLGACLLLAGYAGEALAQAYPSRPVTLVTPVAPGGGADTIARLLAQGLSEEFKSSFVVENKAGANGNVGIASVARAEPTGYTLLMAYSGFQVTNPWVYAKPGWDPIKDFVPVALIGRSPHVMVGKKDLPFSNLKELVAHAKTNPGKLNFASTGIGSVSHIGLAQLTDATGIQMAHIPYRGAGPATNDLIAGTVDLSIVTPTAAMPHLAGGTIKALALLADRRHPMLPDAATVAEQGLPPMDLTVWFAIFAPAGTPDDVVQTLSSRIRAVVSAPAYAAKLKELGSYAEFLDPAELGALTARDLAHWRPIIERAGIKVE